MTANELTTQEEEFVTAMKIAIDSHIGQYRKDGRTPYILHPLAVMLKMNTHEERITALLHDVIEDAGHKYNLNDIKSLFGLEVGTAVELLTKPRQERYQAYIMRLANNPLAAAVKLADLEHNLSTIDSIPDKHERKHLLEKWTWSQIYLQERGT